MALKTRRLPQLVFFVAGVTVCILGGAAALSYAGRRSAEVREAEAWPSPGAPWRRVEDAKFSTRVDGLDAGWSTKSVWRCDRATCGFEGRAVVLGATDPISHEVRTPARLQSVLSSLSPAFAGEIEWPAFGEGQAQALRLPATYAYLIVQSDRSGRQGAGASGEVIDQVVRRIVANAPASSPMISAPRSPDPSSQPAPPPRPAMPTPEEATHSGDRPGWK